MGCELAGHVRDQRHEQQSSPKVAATLQEEVVHTSQTGPPLTTLLAPRLAAVLEAARGAVKTASASGLFGHQRASIA